MGAPPPPPGFALVDDAPRRRTRIRAQSTSGITPVDNALAVANELFPDGHVTDWRRDPNSPLGRRNPSSWHVRSAAAVDMRPIPGMTFDDYVQHYRDAGYDILEARDEVNDPSSHATGPHWHAVLGRHGAAPAQQDASAAPPPPDGFSLVMRDVEPGIATSAEATGPRHGFPNTGLRASMGAAGSSMIPSESENRPASRLTLPVGADVPEGYVPSFPAEARARILNYMPFTNDLPEADAARAIDEYTESVMRDYGYQGFRFTNTPAVVRAYRQNRSSGYVPGFDPIGFGPDGQPATEPVLSLRDNAQRVQDFLQNSGELRQRTPDQWTVPERISYIARDLGLDSVDPNLSHRLGSDAGNTVQLGHDIASMTPIVGGILAGEEGLSDIRDGNVVLGATLIGLGALDFIPGGSGVGREVVERFGREVSEHAVTSAAQATARRMASMTPRERGNPEVLRAVMAEELERVATVARAAPDAAPSGRAVDRIDIGAAPPPPPGFQLVDEPQIGRVHPIGERPTAEDIAASARHMRPEDVIPIPESRISGPDELAEMPDPRPLLEAPNERDELLPRRIPSRTDLFRYSQRRGPLDLSQRLRTFGGIRDDAGELASMGVSNEARRLDFGNDRGLGRLIDNENGLPLDEATFRLWEEGWFPHHPERPTTEALLDALRSEHVGGERIFHPDDLDEVERFRSAQAERFRIEEAANDGSPLADDLGQPIGPHDLDAMEPPVTAYEDLPRVGGRVANINLANIETRGDIRRLLQNVETRFGGFDAATRGRITQGETEALAREMGLTADDLLRRRRGQALNAEQALAARQILAKSSDELVRLAERVRGGSDEDVVAFRRAVVRHAAIQEQVRGATAEAGRALAQFKMMARSRDARGNILQAAIEGAGGRGRIEDVAEAILDLQQDPAKLNTFALAATRPRLRDKLVEVYYALRLSAPVTHVVNVVSNTIAQIGQIPEHLMASGLGRARHLARGNAANPERIILSEVGARAVGMVAGVKQGLKEARRAFRTEMPSDAVARVESAARQAISGRKGRIIRIPQRLLMAEDEFFKAMARVSSINGLAVRQAHQEGLRGDALRQRAAELAANPTPEILEQSFDYARYMTFQRDVGSFGQGVMRTTNEYIVLKPVAPFVRTPTNILKFAVERTPLAPTLKSWRADFRAGGARRDLAISRVVVGSGIGTMIGLWAAQGNITGGGPADENARRLMEAQGWQPYSIRIGDTYYSYARLDPYATILAMAADLATKTDRMTIAQQDRAAAVVVTSIMQQLESKTFLSGISDLVHAIDEPERYGPQFVASYVESITVPAAMSQVARIVDPTRRETHGILERLESRVPGLSRNLEPRRDVFGRPIANEGSVGPDIVSPFPMRAARNDPVARELLRVGATIGQPSRRIVGRRLSPEEYGRYQETAGRYTYGDVQAAMSDPEWRRLDPAARAREISTIIRNAREDARTDLGLDGSAPPPGFGPAGSGAPAPATGGNVSAPPPGFAPVH